MGAAQRNALVTGLYVTQFVGVGFLATGLAAILRDEGYSLELLGWLALAGLVWPLKVLWAPVVDRWGSRRLGHYRGWLLVLQPLMVLAILALIPFGDLSNLAPIIVLGVLLAMLSATQDTASDAIALLVMRGRERGLANGLQVLGGYLGNLLGGGLTVVVYDRWGWAAAMLFLAAVTALPLLNIVLLREPVVERRTARLADSFAALGTVLRQPGAATWSLLVVPLAVGGAGMVTALLGPALVDRGWSLTEVAGVNGVLTGVAGMVGGLLGGLMVRQLGRVRTVVASACVLVLGAVALVVVAFGDAERLLVAPVVAVYYVAFCALTAVLYTVNMDYSRPASAATDYSLVNTPPQVVGFLAGSVALFAAEAVGYRPVAVVAALLFAAAGSLAVLHLDRHRDFLRTRT
ncbi:Predicted arabinose efflux permease, MFS family [Auraticoccus monumenti]|uniref:Predicted arabinose efflux permease, MFS family n=2 Tax=Auraticoccus monumenti TaxID=675864 RepID=A0A1G6YGK5_9ACTN|nr:Predicted arabinose efflux permease, MFS family [Auraticoccus monumenti]